MCREVYFSMTRCDSVGDLNVHTQLVHATSHEACRICGEVFPDRKVLYLHQRQNHAENTCSICHRTYCVSTIKKYFSILSCVMTRVCHKICPDPGYVVKQFPQIMMNALWHSYIIGLQSVFR